MEVEGILAPCVEDFECLHSLSHTHTFLVHVWHVLAALSRVNGRVAATFEQQTRFLNFNNFALAHHQLLGNLLAYAHILMHTHKSLATR